MCKCGLFSNQGKSLKVNSPETLFSPLYKRKDESYIPLSIKLHVIPFLLTFSGSVTYLKLMKPKGLGELCAATSDLANQTGIEKTDLLIIHKPNLTSSHFKRTYKWAMETRGPKSNSSNFYACPGYQQLG